MRALRTMLAAAAMAVMSVAAAGCDLNVGDGNFNFGLASAQATDEWTRTYTLSSGGRVEVRNVNGAIVVEPSPEPGRVEVRAERKAKASSDAAARDLLKAVQIHEDVTPGAIVLETQGPPRSGWGRGYEVKYTLRVPAGAAVVARTRNGGIDLARLPNDVEAATTNGGITAKDLSGHVEVTTTNGGVDASFAAVAPQGLRLQTTNGGMHVVLPRTAGASLSAHVVNGGISVSDAFAFARTNGQDRRRVEGRLNGGGAPVELATTNGGITVDAR